MRDTGPFEAPSRRWTCINCGEPGCLCKYCLRSIIVTAIIVKVIDWLLS